MKRWVLLIFYLDETLEERCERLQQRIDKLALDPLLPCAVLYDRIMGLYDIKSDLINLHVLYKAMTKSLTKEEIRTMEKVARKNGLSGLDDGTERLRGVIRILKKCESVLARYGFDKKRFENTYRYFAGLLKKGDKPFRARYA